MGDARSGYRTGIGRSLAAVAWQAGPRRHRKSAALGAGTCEFWISTSTIRPWQNRSWSRTPCSTWRECCRTRVHRDLLKELLDQGLERAVQPRRMSSKIRVSMGEDCWKQDALRDGGSHGT